MHYVCKKQYTGTRGPTNALARTRKHFATPAANTKPAQRTLLNEEQWGWPLLYWIFRKFHSVNGDIVKQTGWTTVDTIRGRWNNAADTMRGRWNNAADTMRGRWNCGADTMRGRWNDAADTMRGRLNSGADTIRGRWNSGGTSEHYSLMWDEGLLLLLLLLKEVGNARLGESD